MMIVDLLQSLPCARITLYGFDVFSSGSLSGAHPKASAPHAFDAEMEAIRAMASADPQITFAGRRLEVTSESP